MNKFIEFLHSTWELPQNAIGAAVKIICRATNYARYNDATVYSWDINAGLSLGKFIFVPFSVEDPTAPHVQQYIKHEYGHTIQSKYLGWFFLIIIGLPSIIWAGCFKEYRKRNGISYYSFYTERWADILGGVER
jgi:hypothetical protein